MKKLLITTVALFALAGAASAAELSYGAYAEYALEAESFEFGLGAAYEVNALTFSADLTVMKYNGEELELDSIDLGVSYALSPTADVYGVVTLDSDLDYDEAVIGLAVSF